VIARLIQYSFAFAAVLSLAGCATPEPRPAGVGRGISFFVTPLSPKSFEITAGGSRLRDPNELQEAWRKKAAMVANGRHYKVTTPPVVHNNESDLGGSPLLTRSVTGTITLTD
jgi:hypothetical protein